MALKTFVAEELAQQLLAAQIMCRPMKAVAGELSLTVPDGYAVQAALIQQKVGQGDQVVGWKLGLTSKAKQQQQGVCEPIYGAMLASHVLPTAELPVNLCVRPVVEAEIAFVLGCDLAGPGVTAQQAAAAIRGVAPALEVADSRYDSPQVRLADMVADNAAACFALVGQSELRPAEIDALLLEARVEKNGEAVAAENCPEALGDAVNGLVWLANTLGAQGGKLLAGQFVLTGSLTEAVPIDRGDLISARFGPLGSLSLRGVEQS